MCTIKIQEHVEFLLGGNAYLYDQIHRMYFPNNIELLQIKSWPSPICTQIYVRNLPNDTFKRIIKYIPSLIKSMSL